MNLLRHPLILLAPTVLVLAACEPDFLSRPSVIDGPRLIAVVSEPAESEPEGEVAYLAHVASPDGPVDAPDLAWAVCQTPKPPTESRSVSEACLGDGSSALPEHGPQLSMVTPEDACFMFGPSTPPGDARPRDPDITGGFYLPVRATLAGATSFAFHRITCDLANVPVDISIQYGKSYRANDNPVIDALEVKPASPGARVEVSLSWAPESVETFLVYDREARALVERDESMRVSWFATGGTFEHDATGETGPSRSVNHWTAPASGLVHLWAVLRDDRGGTAVAAQRIDVD